MTAELQQALEALDELASAGADDVGVARKRLAYRTIRAALEASVKEAEVNRLAQILGSAVWHEGYDAALADVEQKLGNKAPSLLDVERTACPYKEPPG